MSVGYNNLTKRMQFKQLSRIFVSFSRKFKEHARLSRTFQAFKNWKKSRTFKKQYGYLYIQLYKS